MQLPQNSSIGLTQVKGFPPSQHHWLHPKFNHTTRGEAELLKDVLSYSFYPIKTFYKLPCTFNDNIWHLSVQQ